MTRRFNDPAVAAVFDTYPRRVKAKLMKLRKLIFDTASKTEGVGALDETLKWGQPSYLTRETGSGTTIRIDATKAPDNGCAIYFHCQTNLVEGFRARYADTLKFEGNRAIVFGPEDDIPLDPVRHCVAMALTYHSAKKRKRSKERA